MNEKTITDGKINKDSEILEWVRDYIKTYYNPEHGTLTWRTSCAEDEIFEDGVAKGCSCALKDIANLIGMEIPEMNKPIYEAHRNPPGFSHEINYQ